MRRRVRGAQENTGEYPALLRPELDPRPWALRVLWRSSSCFGSRLSEAAGLPLLERGCLGHRLTRPKSLPAGAVVVTVSRELGERRVNLSIVGFWREDLGSSGHDVELLKPIHDAHYTYDTESASWQLE